MGVELNEVCLEVSGDLISEKEGAGAGDPLRTMCQKRTESLTFLSSFEKVLGGFRE